VSALDVARPAARAPRRRLPLLVAGSAAVLAVMGACAVAGPALAPQDPRVQDLAAAFGGPSAEHLLGTDGLGRDVLSRLVAGARTAVVGPTVVAVGAVLVGTVLALLAGYFGGWVDAVISRWADFMYALPGLLVAVVAVGVLNGGYVAAVLVSLLLFAPYDTRILRAAVLKQRRLPYVEAARMLGVSTPRILFGHLLPAIWPIVLATVFLEFAFALLLLSSLSFLGLGVPPGSPDWGRMLAENRQTIFEVPLPALAPAACIVATAASVNILGDWVFARLGEGRRG